MAADLASLQAALAGTPVMDTEGGMTGNSGPSPWTGPSGSVYNFFGSKAANFGAPGQFDPADLALLKEAGLDPATAEWNQWAMDPKGGGAASNSATFGDALFNAARFAALAYGAGNFDPSSFSFSSGGAEAPLDISGGLDSSSFNLPLTGGESEGLNLDKLLQNQRPAIGPFSPDMSVPAQLGEGMSLPAQTGGPSFPGVPPVGADGFGGPTAPEGVPPGVQGPAPVENGVVKPVGTMQMLQNGSSPAALLAQLSGAGSPLAPLLGQAGGTGALPWGTLGNTLSLGSSVYGLYQANKLKQMAALAAGKADPWGASGGRAMADGQLQALMRDPSSITSTPGYAAGLQAVERRMAAQGFNGSGNMMAALSQYGGQFYNDAIARLGGLAGAGGNPAAGAQLNIQGAGTAANLMMNSLGLLGKTAVMGG